ncbi:PAS domain-containing protein [Carboxylicivirga sp. RSCT41]|uniref:PAS domain-containing protein n=1 Tax=Carboxylicivirga agarovorans TaxID=3417570 RepID=UPI003D33A4E6
MVNTDILTRWNTQLKLINQVIDCDYSCIISKQSQNIEIISEAKTNGVNSNYQQEILEIIGNHVKGFDLTDELRSCIVNNLSAGFLLDIRPVKKDCSSQWGYLILISSSEKDLAQDAMEVLDTMTGNFCNDLKLLYNSSTTQKTFDQRTMNFLLESMNGVPWRMDFKTNEFKYVGNEGERILGYNHADWPTFEKWAACIHPDDREWATNYCYNCSVQDLDHVFEYRLIQKDGKIIWVRDIVIVKRDENNDIAELVGFMINITHVKANEEEQKVANALLENEKQLLNNFIDSIEAFVFMKDVEGRWLNVNEYYTKFYGVPKHELLGKTLDGFVPSKTASLLREKEQEVIRNKVAVNFEYSLNDQTGKEKWFYASYFPVLNDRKEVENLCGTSVEITKIKELERESQKLNQQLEFLLNVTNTQLLIIDEDHNIIYNSIQGEGLNEKCYVHTKGQLKICADCPMHISSVGEVSTQYHSSQKDNRINYQVTTFPYINSDGKKNMAMVRVDITDRIEIENKISLLNQQLELSMLTGRIAFFEYDLKQNEFVTNSHVKDIIGIEIDRGIEKEWLLSRIHPSDLPVLTDQVVALTHGGLATNEMEFRFLDAHQKYLWLSVHINKIQGESTSVSGIIQDITRHKELLIELEIERKKSRAANDAKTNFIASMSHEIRTPMNAILGFSDIMSKNLQDSVYKNYLRSIKTSGKLLLSLINDILDVSKIEAGKVILKYEPVNIKKLLVDLSETLRYSANVKGLEMTLIHPDNLPDRLYVDELRMKQIILNLMNNAVKYTNEGSINIIYYFNKKDGQKQGDLFITVADTGVGIKADRQKAIFEPFEQEGKTINKHVQGTGLGLSIINKLVKLMNGYISLKSKEGEGSQFTIHIPDIACDDIVDEQAPVQNNSEVILSEKSVLIIDDVESNLDILELLLVNLGLKVEAVNNGNDALKMIEEGQFDIMMCDINMPDMNGFEVLERVKQLDEKEELINIAVTASTLDQEVEEIMNAGFDDILTKPISEESIVDVIGKYCISSADNTKQVNVPDEELTFHKEDGLKLYKLLDDKTTEICERLKQRTSTSDLKAFNQALEECTQMIPIHFVMNYQKEVDIAIKSFDFESIQNLLNNYESILNKLIN